MPPTSFFFLRVFPPFPEKICGSRPPSFLRSILFPSQLFLLTLLTWTSALNPTTPLSGKGLRLIGKILFTPFPIVHSSVFGNRPNPRIPTFPFPNFRCPSAFSRPPLIEGRDLAYCLPVSDHSQGPGINYPSRFSFCAEKTVCFFKSTRTPSPILSSFSAFLLLTVFSWQLTAPTFIGPSSVRLQRFPV